MNWFDCLDAFVNVAKHNSFSAGARMLKISTPVITKRIQWLEKQLETSLLIRTTRKIFLTEAGEFLISQISPLLLEWNDIKAKLLDYKSEPQGDLTICTPPNIDGTDLFSKLFVEFANTYPKINLQIKNTSKPIRLAEEGIDILMSTDKYVLEPQNTIRFKLFNYTYNLYASINYLEKFGIPKTSNDLLKHKCLVYADDIIWEIGGHLIQVPSNFKCYSGESLIKSAILGLGIIRVPKFMVIDELKHNYLQEILPNKNNQIFQFNLFYTKHKYNANKIKLLIDFIQNLKIFN
mgnify:CR=1 FL=1